MIPHPSPSPSLVIITGIGRNVLKPSVLELLAELRPAPLQAAEPADNPGRLVVSSQRDAVE